ncbi:MAG: (d)CMP kinase [Thermoplasmatota archaeon]
MTPAPDGTPETRPAYLKPAIAVAGGPGTGTTTLCRALSDRFSLPHVYAGALFRAMAASQKMTLGEFGRYAEAHPEVDHELDARMIAVARAGGIILEGRMSAWHVREAGSPAFRILLTAPEIIRAERVAKRDGGDARTVLDQNRAREASEDKRYHTFYQFDPSDPRQYDFVLDTGALTAEAVLDRVAGRVQEVLLR